MPWAHHHAFGFIPRPHNCVKQCERCLKKSRRMVAVSTIVPRAPHRRIRSVACTSMPELLHNHLFKIVPTRPRCIRVYSCAVACNHTPLSIFNTETNSTTLANNPILKIQTCNDDALFALAKTPLLKQQPDGRRSAQGKTVSLSSRTLPSPQHGE